MKVLIISAAIPFPPISGGHLRTFHIARAIARQHTVTLVGFTFGEQHEAPPYPAHVVGVPWEPPRLYEEMKSEDLEVTERAYRLLDTGLEEPWLASCYDTAAMDQAIREQLSDGVDLVLFEGTPLARFLPLVPPAIPKILDFMDVCSLMARCVADSAKAGERERAEREAARVRAFESWAARQCEVLLVCSEREMESAKHLIGIRDAHIVANGVDTTHFVSKCGKPEKDNLLFTGNFGYAPNAEGAQYFAQEILPLITAHIPSATLHLVGAQPTPAVCNLASMNVRVHGKVDDMRSYQENASVVVVPLLRGGGTKLKVLEAAASANAIVTTPVGVAGLDFTDGENLLIRERPQEFADAVVTVLQEPAFAARLGGKARQASEKYDWAQIENRVLQIVNEMRARTHAHRWQEG